MIHATPQPPESVSSKPTVLVVDDHELLRDGIVRLLNTEGEFTAVSGCGSVDEALETISTASIDVVLLDFDLGHETGRRFIERARVMGFEGKVVILTAGVTDAEISELIASGVSGIFMKHNSAQSLSGCIHHVLEGKVWLEQAHVAAAVNSRRDQPGPAEKRKLTDRELAVLQHVLDGLMNKEIADKLEISESAVKASLQQVFAKTGVRTRSQLVRFALERYRDQF
jgi:two-component system, NarL family, nitrate/nitrite response regulator NarL